MDPKLLAVTPNNLGQFQGFSSGFFSNPGLSPETRTAAIISNVISVFTIFGGLAFIFWFVIGATNWITSSGNSDQVEKAKKQMSSAIVGLVVLILANAIAFILGKITGLDILNLESMINRLGP